MKQLFTITLIFLVNFSYASEPVISLFTIKGKEIKITSMTRSSSGYDIVTAKGAKMFLPNSAIRKCVPGTGLIKKIVEQKSQEQIKEEKEKAVSIEFLKTQLDVLKIENLKMKTQIDKAKREVVDARRKANSSVDEISRLKNHIKDMNDTNRDLKARMSMLRSDNAGLEKKLSKRKGESAINDVAMDGDTTVVVPNAQWKGFRGVNWYDKMSNIPGLTNVGSGDGINYYIRAADKKNIGNAKLDKIYYMGYKNQFLGVMIESEGPDNFKHLKLAADQRYGKPRRPNQFIDSYVYEYERGTTIGVIIELTMQPVTQDIKFQITCDPLFLDLQFDQKTAAGNAAKEDF